MTTHKVEEMEKRIKPDVWKGNELFVDPHKLAAVLCEMEEKIGKSSVPFDGPMSVMHQNKRAYDAGALAALEEVRKVLPEKGKGDALFNILNVYLDELKKKYE